MIGMILVASGLFNVCLKDDLVLYSLYFGCPVVTVTLNLSVACSLSWHDTTTGGVLGISGQC